MTFGLISVRIFSKSEMCNAVLTHHFCHVQSREILMLNIVIARYTEDLTWLTSLSPLATLHGPVRVIIYNKAPEPLTAPPTLPWVHSVVVEDIPNVGREGHTYVHHILKTYQETTQDYTLFLQGDISDHIEHGSNACQYLLNMVEDAKARDGISSSHAKAHACGAYSATYDFRIREWKGTLVPCVHGSFGAWFQHHFKCAFPKQPIQWWSGALFCIHTSRIRHRERAFYEGLMLDLNVQNPEAVHYLERAWYVIFCDQ